LLCGVRAAGAGGIDPHAQSGSECPASRLPAYDRASNPAIIGSPRDAQWARDPVRHCGRLPRGDGALGDAVERTLRSLAESREITWIYVRWFVRPLPSGERIGLPMSTELRRSLELLGLLP